MGRITISTLDDATLAEIERRALQHGRSIEEELCSIVTQAVRPTRDDVLRRIDEMRDRVGARPAPNGDAVSILRELRGS